MRYRMVVVDRLNKQRELFYITDVDEATAITRVEQAKEVTVVECEVADEVKA